MKCLKSGFPMLQHLPNLSKSSSTNFFAFYCPFIVLLPCNLWSLYSSLLYCHPRIPYFQVQDAVRCRMGGCKDDSENSPDSCKNGQVQIMVNSISFHPTLQPISLEVTLLTRLQPLHDLPVDTSSRKHGFHY